jgi:hypothetical protein
LQNLILASVLAATDGLFLPVRDPARQKAADRARVTYGRWGVRWKRPIGKSGIAACRELQRRGLLVRSAKRALLTDRGQAYARALIGVPSLADSWPILRRLRDDAYASETDLIDGLADWESVYRLEHTLLPALTTALAWSKPLGDGLVGYKLSGQPIEPPELPTLSVDREASQAYQEQFLSIAA